MMLLTKHGTWFSPLKVLPLLIYNYVICVHNNILLMSSCFDFASQSRDFLNFPDVLSLGIRCIDYVHVALKTIKFLAKGWSVCLVCL